MEHWSSDHEQFEHQVETVETPKRPRWRMVTAAAAGSMALAGVVAIGVVGGNGLSAASEGAGAQTTTTVKGAPSPQDVQAKRAQHLDQVLQPLVDAGTITDAQRDAVVQKLLADRPAGPGFGRAGHGFRRGLRGFLGAGLDTAAKTIGVSEQDLRSALRDGKSIADVATEHGVAVDKVVDALVAEATAKLGELKLPEGRTAPTADQIRNAITKAVNAKGLGFRGGRGPGWMPGGPDGMPGGQGAPGAPGPGAGSTPSTTAPSPTTTAPAPTTTEGGSTTTTTGG